MAARRPWDGLRYAPLSETAYSYGPGVDYWILGLLGIGVGTLTAGINLIATIICLRAPGMSIRRLPLFVWMTLVTAFLIVVVMPILNAALVMLLIDRLLNAHFFRADTGGSAVLWQHVFWAFGHPEVYIMVLPAFGMISEVIPVFSRQADLRLRFRRRLDAGDRVSEPRRVGASHVRGRARVTPSICSSASPAW